MARNIWRHHASCQRATRATQRQGSRLKCAAMRLCPAIAPTPHVPSGSLPAGCRLSHKYMMARFIGIALEASPHTVPQGWVCPPTRRRDAARQTLRQALLSSWCERTTTAELACSCVEHLRFELHTVCAIHAHTCAFRRSEATCSRRCWAPALAGFNRQPEGYPDGLRPTVGSPTPTPTSELRTSAEKRPSLTPAHAQLYFPIRPAWRAPLLPIRSMALLRSTCPPSQLWHLKHAKLQSEADARESARGWRRA